MLNRVTSKHILCVLAAAFFILCYYLLTYFEITAGWGYPEKLTLAFFFVIAFLWITELIPLFATGLLILFLELVWLTPIFVKEGIDVKKNIFFSPFFSDIILLFMGGFVMSDLLNRYGLSRKMASFVLKGRTENPSIFFMLLMAISAFFSMWISNTATTAMILALVSPIIASKTAHPNLKKMLPIAVAFSANIGGMITPIGTPPNAIALAYLEKANIHISFFNWMLLTLPLGLILLIVLWKILMLIYPIEHIPDNIFQGSSVNTALSLKQRAVGGIFLVTVVAWITSGIHPLSNGEISLLMIIIVFSSGLLRPEDFNKLSWSVLIILGGGLALGIAIDISGLAKQIVNIIMLESDKNVVLPGIAFISGILTTFINNTATANLIVPLAIHLEGFAIQAIIVTIVMCSTNMALPISTPPNVLAFGVGNLKIKDILLPGVIISVVSMLLMIPFVFYIPWIIS